MNEENIHPPGPCEDMECQICCDHNEHDHGFCLSCGKDISDYLIREAEDSFERRDDHD